jgi:Flp pilus assembly protein TadD
MAKPMLVTLPFALLLLDVWPLQRFDPGMAAVRRRPELLRLVKEKLPLFALAAISSAVTYMVHQRGGAVATIERIPLSLRLTNAATSYLAYIGKTLWPAKLAAFYPIDFSAPLWVGLLAAMLLIGVTILALRAGRRRGYLLAGWLWYVGTLIPVIGLVQVGDQSMADRYAYVPLIGLFVIAAWGAAELAARWRWGRRALPAVAACVLLGCAAVARAQVGYWSDSATLWRHALEVTEDNYVAHNNLGGLLAKEGRSGEAIAELNEALRIRPRYALAQNNLGMALMGQGRLDEAAGRLGEAVRLDPDFAQAQANLGMVLIRQGRLAEASERFAEAVRIKPGFAEAHDGLGRALAGQGRVEEAIGQYNEALRLKPDYAEAHNDLGEAFGSEGKLNEAAQQFAEALRLAPDYAEAHNDLGVAFGQQGRFDEAAQQFLEALRIDPSFAKASNNLRMAQAARQGRDGR